MEVYAESGDVPGGEKDYTNGEMKKIRQKGNKKHQLSEENLKGLFVFSLQ